MSDYPAAEELALLLVIPHTTAVRGNRWEFACSKSFLKPGVFHLQQIQPVSLNRLATKLGVLTTEEFRSLGKQLARLLNLETGSRH
jgi:mRNA interferase MazF